ncbi:Beta-galactosidase [Luteitalea pratensis]|uniref:Beta-galactosidase n=1 Tax=Luteitalea pratensis TaxID=1855912 RepID=A0A143PMW7_LUTPR|nr:glycoside hydrolase family 2 TIM barrel-domain containing protein [Luteitalea pratensis]AMY09428.1 Beta-galactosidase [Luteitalea pratensis]
MNTSRLWVATGALLAASALATRAAPFLATHARSATSLSAAQPTASARTAVSLNGEWHFAVDPAGEGERDRWFAPDLDQRRWDRVDVPHCWPVDPRYQYTGRAWYRRSFTPPEPIGSRHARIEFDAVFARARVWLNGTLVGAHEGGYTPFGFDVTDLLKSGQPNVVAVEADNSWSTRTMPGARPGTDPSVRVYPWWDYGGIVRPVALVVSPPVYIQKQRITTTPDLASGAAAIEVAVWVRNTTAQRASSRLRMTIVRLDGDREFALDTPAARWEASAETLAGETKAVTVRTTLPKGAVQLWGLDTPTLYKLRAELITESAPATADLHDATFGIRRFEVRGEELHLNGRAVRLGGANRPSDDPVFGLIEPAAVVERDVRLMKAAGMELQRINHHAPPPALLDLADRLGMLIVPEAANWQLQPSQMDDPAMRADFERQMRELVERDWNHPSVVAWSVGNEYPSDTPSGVRWTRDMAAFVRTIDRSRPITFASYRAFRADLARPEDEGSHYVDFVSINSYAPAERLGAVLDLVHQRYPGKPIVISEFGVREDKVASRDERRRYFSQAAAVLRQRPFVAGASVWTFQDYRSRFPDTAPNGYRPWGLVGPDRAPRDAYHVVATEFATVRIAAAPMSLAGGRLIARVEVQARPDFPSRRISGLTLRIVAKDSANPRVETALPDLAPGERIQRVLAVAAPTSAAELSLEIVRRDGSVMHRLAAIDRLTPRQQVSQ